MAGLCYCYPEGPVEKPCLELAEQHMVTENGSRFKDNDNSMAVVPRVLRSRLIMEMAETTIMLPEHYFAHVCTLEFQRVIIAYLHDNHDLYTRRKRYFKPSQIQNLVGSAKNKHV